MENQRKLALLFIAMALVLVGSLLVSYLAGKYTIETTNSIRTDEAVSAELQATFSALQDAETGQRGFLLTSDESYLDPYYEAQALIPNRLKSLSQFSASGALPRDQVDTLKMTIAGKLEELKATLQLARQKGNVEAVEVVKTNRGREEMDKIRKIFQTLNDYQRSHIREAQDYAATVSQVRNWVFALAALGNLGFLFWAYRQIQKESTNRYIANLETLRQKEVLAVTLASIGDAVILTDLKGRITFLNEVAEQLTGWKMLEAKDKPCAEVFHIINESTRAVVESPVDKVLKTGAIVGLANHTLLIRKDGSEVPIDDSGAPIREVGGDVHGVVLVFRDFSGHKNTEKALLQAKEGLEVASKAKDVFLATLSHELRTPLTPVMVTLSSWQADPKFPAALRSDVEMLNRNIAVEARLIDDLLDVTKISRGKLSLTKAPVELHEILRAVELLYQSRITEKSLTLHLKLEAAANWVNADADRLQQIFWNVLGNAIKFTPKEGTITIETSNPQADQVLIRIVDTGIGMSPTTLERLFTPFEQGEEQPGNKPMGLGLGMAISKALVDAHEGTIEGKSAGLGSGTEFFITFPVVKAPATLPSAIPAHASPKSASGKMHILLVEDHADTAEIMARGLKAIGHTVTVVASVSAALEKTNRENFDLILSDLGLPDGSGLDLIRKVRLHSQVPAIALTGYGMAEDVDRCREAGFDFHLRKPISFDQLQVALAKVPELRAGQ